MAIFLVRHAESEANLDEKLFSSMADHTIPLSQTGLQQATKVGEFLQNFLTMNLPGESVRLWASPYRRTTQTAQGLYDHSLAVPWEKSTRNTYIFFNDKLRERESGYFDGLSDEECEAIYKPQWDHYQKVKQAKGKYFARPYGGESGADVSLRLSSFKETLGRDIQNGHKHHVIVNHGFTLRCFVTSFLNLHPDIFEVETNPSNTAVRLLDIDPVTGHHADYGYIYDPSNGVALTEKPKEPRPFELVI